jgi:hypothetical protein
MTGIVHISTLYTTKTIALSHHLLEEDEEDEEGHQKNQQIHNQCDLYFDDRRSIRISSCHVEENHLFGIDFKMQFDEARVMLPLMNVHFDGQMISQSEAEDLSDWFDSRRPQWVSDHQRQIRDINDDQQVFISTLGLPLKI